MQDYIGRLWKSYRAGEIDSQTAAVTTNAAFELVRRMEEEILVTAPNLFNRKRSWDTIAIIIFYADAFQQGVCPEARLTTNKSLELTPFDDFIYLSTTRILMKFSFLSDMPANAKPDYPVLCPPMRFAYISRPELLGTPHMDQKEPEDLVLSQFMIDQVLWDHYREATKQVDPAVRGRPPMDDELTIKLRKIRTEGELSVVLVFASRIFLDIQDIMGVDVGKSYQELKTIKEIDKIMNLQPVNGA